MTAKPKAASGKDEFHRERSRFLDAFAGLEEALLRNPAAHEDKLLADQLLALRAIRNDLVHSRLRFASLGGELQAVFVNTQHAATVARSGRILLLSDFAKLKSRIDQVRSEVNQRGSTG